MGHRVFGQRLGKDINERKSFFRSLATSLILYNQIKTTQTKAKVIQPIIEKIITKAKKGDIAQRRFLYSYLGKDAYQKLFDDVVKRFKKRDGGFTRIVKLGPRMSDTARMARIEFVQGPKPQEEKKQKVKKEKKPKKRVTKKEEEEKQPQK